MTIWALASTLTTVAAASDLTERRYPEAEYPRELEVAAPDGFSLERDLGRIYNESLRQSGVRLTLDEGDVYESEVAGADTSWGHLVTTAERNVNAELLLGMFGVGGSSSKSSSQRYGFHRAAWTTTLHQADVSPGHFDNAPTDALYYVSKVRMGSIHDYWCVGSEKAVNDAITGNVYIVSGSGSKTSTRDELRCQDKYRALTINDGMLETSRGPSSNFTEVYTRTAEIPILYTLTRIPDSVLEARLASQINSSPNTHDVKLTAVQLGTAVDWDPTGRPDPWVQVYLADVLRPESGGTKILDHRDEDVYRIAGGDLGTLELGAQQVLRVDVWERDTPSPRELAATFIIDDPTSGTPAGRNQYRWSKDGVTVTLWVAPEEAEPTEPADNEPAPAPASESEPASSADEATEAGAAENHSEPGPAAAEDGVATGPPRVVVRANHGEAFAAPLVRSRLESSGHSVQLGDASKKARLGSVIFVRTGYEAQADALARDVPGGADIKPMPSTWDTDADIVLSLGTSASLGLLQ